MHSITQKLTDGFVQSSMVQLPCSNGTSAVDIPDGTETFAITNATKLGEVWVSLGAKGADLRAAVGVGHHLAGGQRLIVSKTPGVGKVAAIAAGGKHSANCLVYVEFGTGGVAEARKF
jgi:hypothetical protein